MTRRAAAFAELLLVAALLLAGAYIALRLVDAFAWVYIRPLLDWITGGASG